MSHDDTLLIPVPPSDVDIVESDESASVPYVHESDDSFDAPEDEQTTVCDSLRNEFLFRYLTTCKQKGHVKNIFIEYCITR
ncbi:hypothetical protein Btru_066340 [Bulinus truncatus]|nr:hypothetical protein Btru_066340 [Bulinus truncatus]